jgi:hypothetical protein
MKKIIFCAAVNLVLFSTARAQGPNAIGDRQNSLIRENLVSFSNSMAEIRKVDGHWELWSGAVKIKNLGNREADAREVLRLLRTFNLNQRGTVGEPQPVMEYWLSNGRAPQKMGHVNSAVFDPDALQVANVMGQWCLVDESRPWLTFGSRAEDARRALQIIQKYGFTDIIYVDSLNPVMMVFLAGHDRRPKSIPGINSTGAGKNSTQSPNQLQDTIHQSPLTSDHASVGPAKWFQPPQLHVNPTLSEPVTGREMVRFDAKQIAVQSRNLNWQLIANGTVLANFGSREHEAREALRAVLSLHLTEKCQIGDSSPIFTFYLSDLQPAHVMFFGARTIPCHAKDLTLCQMGSRWAIGEFDRVILILGTNRDEAQQVLDVLKHYQVDHICQIGSTEPPAVTILVRTH